MPRLLGLLGLALIVAVILFWPAAEGEGLIPEDAAILASPEGATFSVTIRSVRDDAVRLTAASVAGAPLALVKGHAPGGGAGRDHAAAPAVSDWEGAAALALPAGGGLVLPPPGARLVLPPGTAAPGVLLPVTLDFAEAGRLTVNARVEEEGEARMDHGAMAGTHRPAEGEPRPSLTLSVLPEPDGGWMLTLRTHDFRFARDAADGPHVPGEGHGHLYVNGIKMGRVYSETHRLPPLLPGENEIRVEINTNDHRLYVVGGEPVAARTMVEQEG